MPVIKAHVTEEQAIAIKEYAKADGRPVSNLILKALREKAVRTKKHYSDGKVIVIAEKTRCSQSSAHRMDSKG